MDEAKYQQQPTGYRSESPLITVFINIYIFNWLYKFIFVLEGSLLIVLKDVILVPIWLQDELK